jgi:hypothetical protein
MGRIINRIRNRLYYWARLLGDLNALLRGPIPFAKRWIRKESYKFVAKNINKITR